MGEISKAALFDKRQPLGRRRWKIFTRCEGSKLSIALIRPTQPTWNRSSAFSPRPANFWITERTRRRLPWMSASRAAVSPSFAFFNRVSVSSAVSRGSLDVFTEQISTFPCICATSKRKRAHTAPPGVGRGGYVREGFL